MKPQLHDLNKILVHYSVWSMISHSNSNVNVEIIRSIVNVFKLF